MHQTRLTKNGSGVIRSSRCEACRKRKIKCDESWPTCGPCRKRAVACSGPPAAFSHFIAHQSERAAAPEGAETVGLHSVGSFKRDEGLTLVQVRQWSAQDGAGVFTRFRARPARDCRPRLRPPPGNCESVSAQKLVRLIESTTGTQNDVTLRVGWLHLLPARLADNCALSDAVDLFISCWTDPHQGAALSSTINLDPTTYTKAIRSIRLAIAHEERAYSTDTLAAVALMHLTEEQFTRSRGSLENNHASGLQALMLARGPPGTKDELEARILFETLSNILGHRIFRGGPQFLHKPEWIDAMERALDGGAIPEKEDYAQYRLCIFMARWPSLTERLKALKDGPDSEEARSLAEDAQKLSHYLFLFDDQNVEPLLRDGKRIWSVEDQAAPGGVAYTFDEWDTCQLFILHAMVSLAVNQILVSALTCAAVPASPLLQEGLGELSRRVWKSLAYVKKQAPPRRMYLVTPLILSVEYADFSHREALAGEVVSLLGPQQGALLGDDPLPAVMSICRVLTGRPGIMMAYKNY